MNPLFHTEFSISDSLKNVRKSVLIYETIIDGSYVTEVLDQKDIENYRISCDHPAASLVAVGNLANDTKMVATASCCFKYRSVTRCQCKKCGAAVKTYGAWKYHKNHSFPLFGKTCKTCGYKK